MQFPRDLSYFKEHITLRQCPSMPHKVVSCQFPLFAVYSHKQSKAYAWCRHSGVTLHCVAFGLCGGRCGNACGVLACYSVTSSHYVVWCGSIGLCGVVWIMPSRGTNFPFPFPPLFPTLPIALK